MALAAQRAAAARVPAAVDGQRAKSVAAENAARGLKPPPQHVSVEPGPVRRPLERTHERIGRPGAVALPRGEVGQRARVPPERHTTRTVAFGELG